MPAGYTVGAAHIQVLPSIRGLHRDLGRQLKGIRPVITAGVKPEVDTSAANKAEAQLRVISARLSKARDAEAAAVGRVRVAEAQLAEVRDKAGAKASQLADAEERLATTRRALADVQQTVTRTTEEHAAAERRLADVLLSTQRQSRGVIAQLRGIADGIAAVDDRPIRRTLGTLGRFGVVAVGAASAVVAIGSGVPAILSLASALTAVIGVAGLLPAVLGAGALAVGALVLGFAGIGKALKPTQAVAGAVNGLVSARQAADRAAVRGAEQVKAAESALVRAQRSAVDAQADLNRARAEAVELLQDLRLSLRGAALDERSAQLGLQRAQQELTAAIETGVSGLDLEEARLGVDQATQALAETQERYGDLREEAVAAERAGVEGAENVLAAQSRLAHATEGVASAQQDLTRTRRDAAWAELDAAQALQQASERLATAAPPVLAPSAAAFVAAIKRLGPEFTALRLDVQQRLFAGLAERVDVLGGRLLPILRSSLTSVADTLNRSGRGVADFFALPKTNADVRVALADTTKGLDAAAGAAVPLTKAWTDFSVVGASFLPGLGRNVTDLATRLSDLVARTRDSGELGSWIQNGLTRLGQLFDLARNLGGLFGLAFAAADLAGVDLLVTLRDVTGELKTALGSPEGQSGLQTFFASLRGVVDSLLPGLGAVNDTLQVVLSKIGPTLPGVGGAFSAVAIAVAPLVKDLARLTGVVLPPLVATIRVLAPILVPAAVGLTTVYLALRAWLIISTIVTFVRAFIAGQTVLNAVLAANPIGVVVLALVALAAGLIYAYRHSETFRQIVQSAWQGIQASVGWAWEHVIQPVFKALTWYAQNILGPVVLWLWSNIIKPAFSDAGATISWVWGNVIKPAFDALRHGVSLVGQAFSAAVDFVSRVWYRLQEIAARPVNFVIETVYNAGIKAVWDKVAGFVGLPQLPRATPIGLGPAGPSFSRGQAALSAGGVLDGYAPGRDSVPALLSPGEAVLVPELVRAIGPGAIIAANRAASGRQPGGRGGRYAGGGIVGRSLEGIKDFATGAANWTVGLIADPIGTLKRMFGDPAAKVRATLGRAPLVDLVAAVPGRMVSAAVDWLGAKVKAIFGDSVGGGAFDGRGDWPRAVPGTLAANTAAAVAHVRDTFGISNIGTLGNRPNKSDHPLGKALDVMIADWSRPAGIAKGNAVATFFATNPKAFGTKYVIWRDRINSGQGWEPYGHPNGPTNNPTLQHRDHVHVSLYDGGGWLPPGYSQIYNGTGRPEPVLTDAQWRTITRAATDQGGADRHYHLTAQVTPTTDVSAQFRRMEILAGVD